MKATRLIAKAILWMPIIVICAIFLLVVLVLTKTALGITSLIHFLMRNYVRELKEDAKDTSLEDFLNKFDI